MSFKKLPSNSKKLLDEIIEAANPLEMLCKRFNAASQKEDDEIRNILRELRQQGYIEIIWANNLPYKVIINNSARTYNEQLVEYENVRKEEVMNLENVSESKIFISHRSTDKNIADVLVDFFIATGISRDKIFCSSLPGSDVKQKILTEVKETIKNSCLNIAILSKEYYKSVYCLNEAGILWFQDTPVIPIALPEIEPVNMIGFLGDEYKIRRLDNNDDIAYIYDTIRERSKSDQAKMSTVTAESQKLVKRYENIISNRVIQTKSIVESSFEVTTDDEKIVLYYLISKQVRKVNKDTICSWLQDAEIYDVNVENAFDLLSTIGNGDFIDDTLELNIDVFRRYSVNATSMVNELQPIVNAHKILSADKFKEMWNNNFNDCMKLFIAYIVDEKINTFGDRWMQEAQIKNIKTWEDKYSLCNTLSSNYGQCLSVFIYNRFVYESEWTSQGNARAYSLCTSLKDLLFNNSNEFVEELQQVKREYYFELPF